MWQTAAAREGGKNGEGNYKEAEQSDESPSLSINTVLEKYQRAQNQ